MRTEGHHEGMANASLHSTSRPNAVAIAVLEHDLFGIQPEPGTAAALAVRMRSAGHCWQHQPAATLVPGPAVEAVCTQCGHRMELNDDGHWVFA